MIPLWLLGGATVSVGTGRTLAPDLEMISRLAMDLKKEVRKGALHNHMRGLDLLPVSFTICKRVVLDTVDGRALHLKVRTVMRAPEPWEEDMIDLGAQITPRRHEINLNLNAKIPIKTWIDVTSSAGLLHLTFEHLLVHELAHARDPEVYSKDLVYPDETQAGFWEAYYNHPTEVRAYLALIIWELSRKSERSITFYFRNWGPTEGLINLLAGSPTWRRMSVWLSESNRRYVIKSVARSLVFRHPELSALVGAPMQALV